MINAAYFLKKAEQCFRLSKADGLTPDMARELNELGQDLMAKAVYLDTLNKRVTASPDALRATTAQS
jgi:hypothetical protein